jgi:hypothetical protein
MLTLTEHQFQLLMADEEKHFINAVADQFLSMRSDMRQEPGRTAVIERMRAAYDNGIDLGFTSTGHLIYMMSLSADYPGLFAGPIVRSNLRKAGMTPEQRLDDMKSMVSHLITSAQQREEERPTWSPSH